MDTLKELWLDFYENTDSNGNVCYQRLEAKNPEIKFCFEVTNDKDCESNLLNVDNFVKIINLGIKIGRLGFDSVSLGFQGEYLDN